MKSKPFWTEIEEPYYVEYDFNLINIAQQVQHTEYMDIFDPSPTLFYDVRESWPTT